MTFWHFSVSCNAHLPHLPSPVMVTSLSAANAGKARRPASATTEESFFIGYLVLFWETVVRLLDFGDCSNKMWQEKRGRVEASYHRLLLDLCADSSRCNSFVTRPRATMRAPSRTSNTRPG